MADDQCVFCHIAAGKIPAKKVFEDDKVTAVLDINPATDGHVLVIPKAHIAVMPQMDDDLVAHVGMVAKQLSHALIRALKAEGTTVFVANGAAAGQRAPHFMLHLIPRKIDDDVGVQLPISKIPEDTMKQMFSKLAGAVAKQFGKELPVPEKPAADKLPTTNDKLPTANDKPQNGDKPQSNEKPPTTNQKPISKGALDEIADFLTGGKK